MIGNDPAVLQTNNADEQTNTGRHTYFQIIGDAHDDPGANSSGADNHEQHASDKNSTQRRLPGITHIANDGVSKQCV